MNSLGDPYYCLNFFGFFLNHQFFWKSWDYSRYLSICCSENPYIFPYIALGFYQNNFCDHSGITSEILPYIALWFFLTYCWHSCRNSSVIYACTSSGFVLKYFYLNSQKLNSFGNTTEDSTKNPDAILRDIFRGFSQKLSQGQNIFFSGNPLEIILRFFENVPKTIPKILQRMPFDSSVNHLKCFRKSFWMSFGDPSENYSVIRLKMLL